MGETDDTKSHNLHAVSEPGHDSDNQPVNSDESTRGDIHEGRGDVREDRGDGREDRGDVREDRGDTASMRRRGIYLLPNLITTGALFAGWYAIVAGMNGQLIAAALAVFAAIALDTADGRVARKLHTESQFGAEYDSLSDLVAFGVAPALVAYSWGLNSLGKIGWMVTFVYMACAALRLARYNTKGDISSFTGLASPSAAAIIACAVWAWTDTTDAAPSLIAASGMGVVVVIVALLMVSNFTYFSPKGFDIRGRVPFITMVLAVLLFAILLADLPRALLFFATLYALSGPAQSLWELLQGRKSGSGEEPPLE